MKSIFQIALAPEIISQSSIVILACRALFFYNSSFEIIYFAFFDAFSIAFILALCSLATLFSRALHIVDETYKSYIAGIAALASGYSIS